MIFQRHRRTGREPSHPDAKDVANLQRLFISEPVAHRHVDPKLLAALTNQRGRFRLTRLDLATRKLPPAGHFRRSTAPRRQKPSFMQHSGGHDDQGHVITMA
jgi:hypothetical protein